MKWGWEYTPRGKKRCSDERSARVAQSEDLRAVQPPGVGHRWEVMNAIQNPGGG